MSDHRNVGDILVGLGRLEQDDIDRALAHQREHGGFFGESLLALELLSRQELDWVLASQFDVPYVVPNVDEVDLTVARWVTREWAIAHCALPIVRTEEALSVVVAAPNQEAEALASLQERVGLRVEPALASVENISELIRQVFDTPVERRTAIVPSRIAGFFEEAVHADATRFGVSAAGYRATGWYESRGRIVRVGIDARWRQDLNRLMIPPLSDATAAPLREWTGDLLVTGAVFPVQVRELHVRGGVELLFELRTSARDARHKLSPPKDLLSEIAVIVASGTGKFRVSLAGSSQAFDVLPHLPSVLLDRSLRCLHLTDRTDCTHEAAVLVLPNAPERDRLLDALDHFAFDALTADVSDRDESLTTRLTQLAVTTFVLGHGDETDAAAFESGLRWDLTISEDAAGQAVWQVVPLRLAGT